MTTVEVGDGEGLGPLRSGTRYSTNSSKVQQGRWVHPGTEGVSRGTLKKKKQLERKIKKPMRECRQLCKGYLQKKLSICGPNSTNRSWYIAAGASRVQS